MPDPSSVLSIYPEEVRDPCRPYAMPQAAGVGAWAGIRVGNLVGADT